MLTTATIRPVRHAPRFMSRQVADVHSVRGDVRTFLQDSGPVPTVFFRRCGLGSRKAARTKPRSSVLRTRGPVPPWHGVPQFADPSVWDIRRAGLGGVRGVFAHLRAPPTKRWPTLTSALPAEDVRPGDEWDCRKASRQRECVILRGEYPSSRDDPRVSSQCIWADRWRWSISAEFQGAMIRRLESRLWSRHVMARMRNLSALLGASSGKRTRMPRRRT